MRTLGYFAIFLSVLYMLACSKDNGGNSTATAAQPRGLTNGQITAYGAQSANTLSNDIVQGRIVNKRMIVGFGSGEETILDDSCLPDNINKILHVQITGQMRTSLRMPMGPNQFKPTDMELVFDANGNLTVRVTNRAGQQVSQPITPQTPLATTAGASGVNSIQPQTYFLDDASQSIVIGPFSVMGIPSLDYVHEILSDRGLISRRSMDRLDPATYNQYMSMNPNNGFSSNFQPGQNPNAQPLMPQQIATQNIGNATPLTISFDPMILKIRTAGQINRQHIFEMGTSKRQGTPPVIQMTDVLVADPALNPRSCYVRTRVVLPELVLVKIY